MPGHPEILATVVGLLAVAGVGQAWFGWMAFRRFLRHAPPSGTRPPITVLKPLHGDEPLLEQALASFCVQDYPAYQLVFGVQSEADSALAVVRRLQRRFPAADIEVVIDPTQHGKNRKVSNLINMYHAAKHNVLLVSDSDMHVDGGYLAQVADALEQDGTGLVTTIYAGYPARRGLAGLLGAAYINQVFAPGALLARWLGRQDCLGATMAIERTTLARVGGFSALAPFVADDAVLGQRIRALGLAVRLATVVPATTVAETRLAALFGHELRWARTVRSIEPVGFALSIVQYPVFFALLTVVVASGAAWSCGLLAAVWTLRAKLARDIEHRMGAGTTPLWMHPLRDTLSVVVMLAAFVSRDVVWRGQVVRIADDERIEIGPGLVPGEG